jgi:toluene monooxygenase system protein E
MNDGSPSSSSQDTLKPLKTWSHLAGQRKRPSEYEVVTVNTLFRANEREALELASDVPMNRWYKRYRAESRLQHDDWNAFRDPDAVTYRAYCTERDRDEVYVEGLLGQYAAQGHDRSLAPGWVETLAAMYTPCRYLFHTAQMASAYAVSMAPASTVVNCAVFQMADSFRWVSRVAYRTAELRKSWPQTGFGDQERARWEKSAEWQGFREMMERLLATYDWGESLLALNLVALPAIDVALDQLKQAAIAQNDGLTRFLIDAQLGNSARRTRWTQAFLAFICQRPENRALAQDVIARWSPYADRAVQLHAEAFGAGRGAAAVAAQAGARPALP